MKVCIRPNRKRSQLGGPSSSRLEMFVFNLADEKIEFVESFEADGPALANARSIAVHPNGNHAVQLSVTRVVLE